MLRLLLLAWPLLAINHLSVCTVIAAEKSLDICLFFCLHHEPVGCGPPLLGWWAQCFYVYVCVWIPLPWPINWLTVLQCDHHCHCHCGQFTKHLFTYTNDWRLIAARRRCVIDQKWQAATGVHHQHHHQHQQHQNTKTTTTAIAAPKHPSGPSHRRGHQNLRRCCHQALRWCCTDNGEKIAWTKNINRQKMPNKELHMVCKESGFAVVCCAVLYARLIGYDAHTYKHWKPHRQPYRSICVWCIACP